jgi:hypothetical protein
MQACLTSRQHLPASGRSASSSVPALPKPVANIAPWIPSLLYAIGFLLPGAESVPEITLSRVSGYRRSHISLPQWEHKSVSGFEQLNAQ